MTREQAIELLDTDEGVTAEEWDNLAPILPENIRVQVRATEGRFYLPADYIRED